MAPSSHIARASHRLSNAWSLLTIDPPGESSDTPHRLKAGRFSVHPGRHPLESPKALPAPLNVSGRVLIAVEHQPTGGADVGAHAQALLDARPAATTVLR